MKYKAIYNEITSTFLKGNQITVGEFNGSVGITTDGFEMFFIPVDMFPFSIEVLTKGKGLINVKNLIPDKACTGNLSNDIQERLDGKIQIQKIYCDGLEVWVNKKFLKYFKQSAEYHLTGKLSPVLVYENDNLVGLIMPFKDKKVEQ